MSQTNNIPPGYRQVLYWRLTHNRRALLIANFLGVVLLLAALVVFMLIASLVQSDTERTASGNCLSSLVFFALVIIVHELVHGLAMLPFGARPKFGVKMPGLAYATAPGHPFPRNGYVIVALAPLVLISLLGIPLLALLPPGGLSYSVILALSLNVAGAIGDLMITAIVLRYPANALVIDKEDGMRILLPQNDAANCE